MGRLKTLALTFRDFATNHVEEPDVPAATLRVSATLTADTADFGVDRLSSNAYCR